MKNVISIGINNVTGLNPLSAAVSGAEDFNNWAISQGYQTKLFIDNENIPVLINDIFNEINRIIDNMNCDQLIIFFAGHGILLSPGQEVWLLSNVKNNPNESINLAGSIANARLSGIPNIVFISDTCRTLPTELFLTGNGSEIFPIGTITNFDCAIDILYATRPAHFAYELKSFGLFTQSLLEILNGKCPEIIYGQTYPSIPLITYHGKSGKLHYPGITINKWFIDAYKIINQLKLRVNQKASSINITLNQNPQIIIQYQDPKPYLSTFDDETARNLLSYQTVPFEIYKDFESNILDTIQNTLKDRLRLNSLNLDKDNKSFKSILEDSHILSRDGDYKNNSNLINIAEKIFNIKDTENFDKKTEFSLEEYDIENVGIISGFKTISSKSDKEETGFTIVGNNIANVVVSGNKIEKYYENNNTQIIINKGEVASSALIILKNGHSIPVAVLKGFIGTLIFEENRLLTINYSPSKNNSKYEEFKINENKIKFVRAFIASSANEGFDYQKTFNYEFDKHGQMNYDNPGSFLRREKSLDPSLGLYAVYAYIQAGRMNDVKSVYKYMSEESYKMLFDIAMLSGENELVNDDLAPFCPMLSLGWAYRNRFNKYLQSGVIEASKYLVPNLWTTFDKKGTEIILKLIMEGSIL